MVFAKEGRDVSKKSLGAFVRELRLKAGYKNIQALANAADVERSYLSRLEAGKETGSIDSLKQIAIALNVPLSTLINVYADLPMEDTEADPDIILVAQQIKELPPLAQTHIKNQIAMLRMIRIEDLGKIPLVPVPNLFPPASPDAPANRRARDEAEVNAREDLRAGPDEEERAQQDTPEMEEQEEEQSGLNI